MTTSLIRSALIGGILVLGSIASAAEPEKIPAPKEIVPEKLPAPERAMPEPMPIGWPACQRVSNYAVWQYYGVDHRGGFKPLVIAAPEGAYYLYNGAPYPWTTTHQMEIMPYTVD